MTSPKPTGLTPEPAFVLLEVLRGQRGFVMGRGGFVALEIQYQASALLERCRSRAQSTKERDLPSLSRNTRGPLREVQIRSIEFMVF